MTVLTAPDTATAAARLDATPRIFAMPIRLLSAKWTYGRLTPVLPNGEVHLLEDDTPGPSAVMKVLDYGITSNVSGSPTPTRCSDGSSGSRPLGTTSA